MRAFVPLCLCVSVFFTLFGSTRKVSAIAAFGFWHTFETRVMFNPEILLRISKEVGAPVSRVEITIKLLEEGGTIPFIARYRKEATGNLDEVKIRDIDARRQYYADLESRRGTVLSSIEKQGKLTDDLKAKILACYNKNELEDLYLPFKPKRKTNVVATTQAPFDEICFTD